jgi:hypothetical protein
MELGGHSSILGPWIILDMFGDIGVLIAVVLYIGIQTGS